MAFQNLLFFILPIFLSFLFLSIYRFIIYQGILLFLHKIRLTKSFFFCNISITFICNLLQTDWISFFWFILFYRPVHICLFQSFFDCMSILCFLLIYLYICLNLFWDVHIYLNLFWDLSIYLYLFWDLSICLNLFWNLSSEVCLFRSVLISIYSKYNSWQMSRVWKWPPDNLILFHCLYTSEWFLHILQIHFGSAYKFVRHL